MFVEGSNDCWATYELYVYTATPGVEAYVSLESWMTGMREYFVNNGNGVTPTVELNWYP